MKGRIRTSSTRGQTCFQKCVRVGRCIVDVCLCVQMCRDDIIEVVNAGVWVLSECVWIKWVCVFVTQTPLCPWKEVRAGQDCDTNEEAGQWNDSDFLTHTHTENTLCPRCLDTPHRLFFYNSSSIFLRGQMSSFGVTGRQRADRAWPASQTSAWKHCHYSIHKSSMTLLAGFTDWLCLFQFKTILNRDLL